MVHFVCLPVCSMPQLQNGAFYGCGYYGTLIRNLMLEVEPTGQHGYTTTRSGQNDNEDIASAASEAFLRWLHLWYNTTELLSAEHIVLPCERDVVTVRVWTASCSRAQQIHVTVRLRQNITSVIQQFGTGRRLWGLLSRLWNGLPAVSHRNNKFSVPLAVSAVLYHAIGKLRAVW